MGNISVKINLASFVGASIIKSGKNKDVDCIIIPIELNRFFKSEKGAVYCDLMAFELKNRKPDQKDTHLVKQSFSKEVRDAMTDEQKKDQPIVGNLIVWDESGTRAEAVAAPVANEDDLPF